MNWKAIAYILAEFPSITETFILKEALLINESLPLHVFVLGKKNNRINTQVYSAFGNRIIYVPHWWSLKILLHAASKANILYRKVTFSGFLHRMKVLLVSSYIAKKMEEVQIRHIHAHFANYPTDVAMMVSGFSGIPFSFTAHAHDIYVNAHELTTKIKKAMFVTTCTAYNKNWLDALTAAEHRKIHLIYHGVDMNCWQSKQPKPVRKQTKILTIGRLIEKKGIIFLLEAICNLLNKGIPVQLSIVGKGVEESRLKRFCKEYGLERRIDFLGWQTPDQIKDLYFHSDIFVLPSVIASNGDRDGIPNVVLEAMAAGIPVISTSVSGIPEVIENGVNGLLVPERNNEQLTRAIDILISERELRNTLVENAYKTVKNRFDNSRCCRLLLQLFENVLHTDAAAPVSEN
jgi:glycosyltransferase involved in cell wall biosynthesis